MQRKLEPLTTVVTVMVTIQTAIAPLIQLWAVVHLESLQTYVGPIATELDYGTIAFTILTMIIFSVWIYQAGSNLIEKGFEDLEYTPAARIWWFAIPFANLFKPYQGMRELWNASHGNGNYTDQNDLVSLWWVLWLVSSIGGNFVGRMDPASVSPLITWSLVAAEIASAVVAIVMIRRIAAAQQHMSTEALSEVFA